MTKKLKTVPVIKSESYQEERMFVNPPYTVFGSPHLPESFSLIMEVGGLRQMLNGLDDEDCFRIEAFVGDRATEYSFIKKNGPPPNYKKAQRKPKLRWVDEN